MKSFKSFNKLVQDESRIENILLDHEKYHAHTHKNKDYEKLHEHVHLVMDYASNLVDVHRLDIVIDSLINDLIKISSNIEQIDTVGNFIKRLFVNSLIYHDYGKVNENFQIDKMQDQTDFKRNESNKIGSQHSILSAFIFLNVHLTEITKIKKVSTSELNFLIVLTYLFSNPILKHHSSFFEHDINFEEEKLEALQPYLKLFSCDITKKTKYLMLKIPNVIQKVSKSFSEDKNNYFAIFSLLKLNFSLLTSSDYYATNHFMSDMPIRDFGVIDAKMKNDLLNNFTKNKNALYNGDLVEKIDFYNKLEFLKIQDRNNPNLNKLRQKMAAEAITTLRKNINNKLFYLEAPTGGGKTNMSFACALELLKSDSHLNKVFYVFPFTTLITQTFKSIKDTLQITDNEVIQLHSKSGFHTSSKEVKQDGLYGDKKLNYINNLFINYPFTLLSHIKFFNILKSNGKEANYILHRLSNSIVVIDELQTYTPKHWDKIIFFLHNYAKHFNVRFIIMSATLPKIDKLSKEAIGKVVPLIPNKHHYFTNPNFKDRISFDFSLLGKNGKETIKLNDLATVIHSKLEKYAKNNDDSSNGLIEFIFKKSASKFFKLIFSDKRFEGYQKFIISGTILEPRRREIINAIKTRKFHNNKFKKSIVVTTQVIEAGVDIDMDIGFKDKSIVDSDEQLAGRVNRNAKKNNCKVFIFNYDREAKIYGKDKRYEQKLSKTEYESILNTKNFDKLYNKVHLDINNLNESDTYVNLDDYKKNFKEFNFRKIHKEFKLIDTDTISVFVPLDIDKKWFSKNELKLLNCYLKQSDKIQGERVFELYKKIVFGESDFIKKIIDKKQISGIMSKFIFSTYTNSNLLKEILNFADHEIFESFGIVYLSHYKDIYTYEGGLDESKFHDVSNQIF